MGFDVRVSSDAVRIVLWGWDRAMNWRRCVVVERSVVAETSVVVRSLLEDLIDHRVMGCGTHDGRKRPNRRRVGIMLGRGRAGRQFWAVPATDGSVPLLVLDLRGGEFERVVVTDRPLGWAGAEALGPP